MGKKFLEHPVLYEINIISIVFFYFMKNWIKDYHNNINNKSHRKKKCNYMICANTI